MDNFESQIFGSLLRNFRHGKLTQDRLAHNIGKSRGSIQAWETGKYLPETRDVVLALAHALRLTEDETDRLLLAAHHPPKYRKLESIPQAPSIAHQKPFMANDIPYDFVPRPRKSVSQN